MMKMGILLFWTPQIHMAGDTAPQEAKDSYKCYLEHEKKYGRCVGQKKIEAE